MLRGPHQGRDGGQTQKDVGDCPGSGRGARLIPHLLFDFAEEKPEPDYYICTDGFDPVTGGRFLSREERQIARRMELYDRIGKGERLGSLLPSQHLEDERASSAVGERSEAYRDGDGQTWFGVALGRTKGV